MEGQETRAKLPAGFYGFKMADGLWKQALDWDTDRKNGGEANWISSHTTHEPMGYLNKKLLEPGGFQELVEHEPQ